LGMFLSKHVPGLRRREGIIIIKPPGIEEDGYIYEFPPLEKCRAEFEKLIHQKIEWNECAEWRQPRVANREDVPF
jgi:hypothetical protein